MNVWKDPASEREWREAIVGDQRDNREGAKAFAAACAAGDVDAFVNAVRFLHDQTSDGWRLGMMRVARLPAVSAEIRAAFLNIWIESKMLPLKVGDRRVLADALRLLMPCDYRGAPIRLYRGASWQERRRRRYGFSWTQHRTIARGFAEPFADTRFTKWGGGAKWGGGVVLEALAQANAVLLMREEEAYYDEGEVVVDPFKLGSVTVAERLVLPPLAGA